MKTDKKRNTMKWMMLWAAVAAFVLTTTACDKGAKGEAAAEKAKKEIIDSIPVPAGSTLRSTKIDAEEDRIIISYGSKDNIQDLAQFFKKTVDEKGYNKVVEGEVGVTYYDAQKRLVAISWYPRDPDISDFNSVFHVLVQPLPPALKPPKQEG